MRISIFGESHGPSIGVVLDGFPAGVTVDWDEILADMARRAPGQGPLTTARREADVPQVQSGLMENVTTGAPICALIANGDQRSRDYEALRVQPRPGHSDLTGAQRYGGHNDIRGGGHFSGRLTAPLVFAGALCRQALARRGVTIGSHIAQIGESSRLALDPVEVTAAQLRALTGQSFPVLEEPVGQQMLGLVEQACREGDSVGGIVECAVTGLEAGIGSPMLQSVESRVASILYGIPAVKGVEFGDGFGLARMRGSEANDPYAPGEPQPVTTSNHNGGVLGGITTGMPLVVRVAFKPTPSIAREQHTLNRQTGKVEPLMIRGRHDPCIVLRAPVVVESAVAVALLDLYLEAKGYEA
ncbi:MAG: chorismate synthase [Eubacteriales bacterium]